MSIAELQVGKSTIISSHPDAYGRTVCHQDEHSRQARYGRIHSLSGASLLDRIRRRGSFH